MRGTRIAAVVATTVVAALSAASAPAGADEPRPPRIAADPGYAYVYVDDAPVAPANATTTFRPPPNDDFVFRYAPDVSAQKRAVFEAAGGIWSSVLEVEVPITVGVTVESFDDPGILGGAAPNDLLANDAALPASGVWYVAALANQFFGRDADPARPEIDVLISSDYDFDEGIGTPVAADRVSLLTLALHELGHGLGHTSLGRVFPDRTGAIRHDGLPLTFDLFIRDQAGTRLVDLGPAALGRAMTERLLWTGSEGARADGGFLPELFAPRLFQPGSSVSHVDEATYGSDLMTPFIAPGEQHTAIPALTRAMMADSGWGLEVRTPAETLVVAMTRDFVKRFPTPTEVRLVAGRLAAGTTTRHDLADAFATSDEWVGAAVDGLYLTTLGRPADPAGRSYWSARLREGTTSAEVAAHFFASSEFYARAGGTNRAWVLALYRTILGREPDAAGLSSWTAAADSGVPRSVVAASIYQAPESRGKRVTQLYRHLLGREPDVPGLEAWTESLRDGRDIRLAIGLASSPEYADRAMRRFG